MVPLVRVYVYVVALTLSTHDNGRGPPFLIRCLRRLFPCWYDDNVHGMCLSREWCSIDVEEEANTCTWYFYLITSETRHWNHGTWLSLFASPWTYSNAPSFLSYHTLIIVLISLSTHRASCKSWVQRGHLSLIPLPATLGLS